jgi:predicted transposase YbfD/YdcC
MIGLKSKFLLRSIKIFFERFLDLSHEIPSHDTFGRVFCRLDPEAFCRCFMSWVSTMVTLSNDKIVAIDGKTLRRSFDKVLGKGAVHIVSAFAAANRVVLGQLQVDSKENEIIAIPYLIELLDLEGCIVTIDAIGCQKKIAASLVNKKSDYILRLKDNHPNVHDEVKEAFVEAAQHDSETVVFHHEMVDGGHGRVEIRRVQCTSTIGWFEDKEQWKNLNSFVKIISEKYI